jgi:hypothetical protein
MAIGTVVACESVKAIGCEGGPFDEINEVADGMGTVGRSVEQSTGEKMP